MDKKFVITLFGFLVLLASQGWAGTMGNGSVHPRVTKYIFCYAGNPKVVYFTQIITVTPSDPLLGSVKYSNYIQETYGIPSIDRMRCVPSSSYADAVAEKQRELGMFGRTKIIEIKWVGDSAVAH